MLQGLMFIFALFSNIAVFWSIPFIFLFIIGLRLYKIENNKDVQCVFSRISGNSSYVEDEKPRGWIWGRYYLGYILETASNGNHGPAKTVSIFILCSRTFYKNIKNTKIEIEKPATDDDMNDNAIKYYERHGTFFWLEYRLVSIFFTPDSGVKNETNGRV